MARSRAMAAVSRAAMDLIPATVVA